MSLRVKQFTFTTHIRDEHDQDIDVLVTALISGKYVKARMYGDDAHPAEYPEIEIETVEDMNGVDITDRVSSYEMDRLVEKAEESMDEDSSSLEYDEDRDDDR